jgi:hypothetical protein
MIKFFWRFPYWPGNYYFFYTRITCNRISKTFMILRTIEIRSDYTVLLRTNLMLRTRSERVPKRPSWTDLPERVWNTFENAFGTCSWMRSETRVISLWSFESLRKIPNTISDNTVNPNSSNAQEEHKFGLEQTWQNNKLKTKFKV